MNVVCRFFSFFTRLLVGMLSSDRRITIKSIVRRSGHVVSHIFLAMLHEIAPYDIKWTIQFRSAVLIRRLFYVQLIM